MVNCCRVTDDDVGVAVVIVISWEVGLIDDIRTLGWTVRDEDVVVEGFAEVGQIELNANSDGVALGKIVGKAEVGCNDQIEGADVQVVGVGVVVAVGCNMGPYDGCCVDKGTVGCLVERKAVGTNVGCLIYSTVGFFVEIAVGLIV